MSLEQNRSDFENALRRSQDSLEKLEEVVEKSILEPMFSMIVEYTDHYQNDIEFLIDNNDDLEERISRLENRITELTEEIDDLEDANSMMEDIIAKYED